METLVIENDYSRLSIPKINQMGTGALTKCLVTELQQRGVWDDELAWSINYAIEKHEDDPRKDGPYPNHILRVALWAVRGFNTFHGELAKAAVLHDLAENHPDEVIEELSPHIMYAHEQERQERRQDMPADSRQQAVWMLGESGWITNRSTVTSIGRLTCPSYSGLDRPEKNRQYGLHILDKIVKCDESGLLIDPVACAAKTADQLDNGNGNHYNPDEKMQRRLDLKYYPVNELLREAVTAPNSLIPEDRQEIVVTALKNGQEAARLRLIHGSPKIPGLDEEIVDALSIKNLLELKTAA